MNIPLLIDYIKSFKKSPLCNPHQRRFYDPTSPMVFVLLPPSITDNDHILTESFFIDNSFDKDCNIYYVFSAQENILSYIKETDFILECPNWERDRTKEEIKLGNDLIDKFNLLTRA